MERVGKTDLKRITESKAFIFDVENLRCFLMALFWEQIDILMYSEILLEGGDFCLD